MEREVAALIALAGGRPTRPTTAGAVRRSRSPAAAMPARRPPAPELLGEVLLEVGRPQDAIELFEQALRRNPNRSLSVLGARRRGDR
jgi:tetratricopeptide (TPR) repeat protein